MARPRGDNKELVDFEGTLREARPEPMSFRDVYPERFSGKPDPMGYQALFPDNFDALSDEEKMAILKGRALLASGPIERPRGTPQFSERALPVSEEDIAQYLIDSIEGGIEPPMSETEKRLNFVGPPAVDPIRPIPPRRPYALERPFDTGSTNIPLDTGSTNIQASEQPAEEPLTPQSERVSAMMRMFGLPKVRGRQKVDYQASIDAAQQGREQAAAYESARRREAEANLKLAANKITEAENLQGEYKFDPNRAMPTLGSKIAAAVAIALGEAARGFRGGQGPNVGLDLINQAMEREIERQKMEYSQLGDRVDAARNLYKRNFDILGVEQAAEDLTRSQILAVAAQKANVLLTKAQQAEQNNRLQQELAMKVADFRFKTFRSMGQAAVSAKPVSPDFAKGVLADLNKAGGLIRDVAQAKNAVERLISADPTNVQKIGEQLNRKDGPLGLTGEFLGVKLQRALNEALTATDENGRNSFIAQAMNIVGTELDVTYEAANDLKNIIQVLAFGMARQGQSASSISNRDVGMFVKVLADTARDPYRLYDYMEHLQELATVDAFMHDYMLRKQKALGDKSPLEMGQLYTEAFAAAKQQFDYNEENKFFETKFTRQLAEQNELDGYIRNSPLGQYGGI